jgi:hypothetical protein
MTDWGPAKYGDPCRECGYEWSITQDQAMALVADLPRRFREALEGHDATLIHPDLTWSAAGYVAHVCDNLRIFAERFAAFDMGAYGDTVPYDPDKLAEARAYNSIPVAGALWSLENAARDLVRAVEMTAGQEVSMVIDERGPQNVLELIKTTTHDGYHHVWDVQRTVATAK